MQPSTDKSWATKVIDLYTEGCSDAEVAASLRLPIKEYYKQINDNRAFGQLVEFGRTLSLAFWESQARKNIGNKSFNSSLFSFYMKNKFGWADKSEVLTSGDNPDQDLDKLRSKVTEDVAKFIERYTPELTDAQRVLRVVNDEISPQ